MLKLPQETWNTLRAHGEDTYPHECCGVLLGHFIRHPSADVIHVEAVVRASNTRTDSAHNRYHIAPVELVRIQRQARDRGLDIVGFYHSHPDHPAQWSQTDFAEAHWLGCSYVITAVEQGKSAITNAFRLQGANEDDKQFLHEKIEVELPTAELPEAVRS